MPDTFPLDAIVIIVTFLTFALWAYVVDQTAEQEEKRGRRDGHRNENRNERSKNKKQKR